MKRHTFATETQALDFLDTLGAGAVIIDKVLDPWIHLGYGVWVISQSTTLDAYDAMDTRELLRWSNGLSFDVLTEGVSIDEYNL